MYRRNLRIFSSPSPSSFSKVVDDYCVGCQSVGAPFLSRRRQQQQEQQQEEKDHVLCIPCSLTALALSRWHRAGMKPKVPFSTLPSQFSFLCDAVVSSSLSSPIFSDVGIQSVDRNHQKNSSNKGASSDQPVEYDLFDFEQELHHQEPCARAVEDNVNVSKIMSFPFPFRAFEKHQMGALDKVSYPASAPLRYVTSEEDAQDMLEAARMPPNLPSPTTTTTTTTTTAEEQEERRLSVVALDTETQPPFFRAPHLRKGTKAPSLVQLATRRGVFLIRTSRFSSSSDGGPALVALKTILESPEILKVGLATFGDVGEIQSLRVEKLQKPPDSARNESPPWFTPRCVLDLGLAARQARIMSRPGLAPLVAAAFGRRLSKAFQLSDWGAPRLGRNQLLYAATDAWICLLLFEVFLRERIYMPCGDDLLAGLYRPLITSADGAGGGGGLGATEVLEPLWDNKSLRRDKSAATTTDSAKIIDGDKSWRDNMNAVPASVAPIAPSSAKFVVIENFDDSGADDTSVNLPKLIRMCQVLGTIRNATLCQRVGEKKDEQQEEEEEEVVIVLRCGNKKVASSVAEFLQNSFAADLILRPKSQGRKVIARAVDPQTADAFTAGMVRDRAESSVACFVPKDIAPFLKLSPTPFLGLLGHPPHNMMTRDPSAAESIETQLTKLFASYGFPPKKDVETCSSSTDSTVDHVVSVSRCVRRGVVIELSSAAAALRATSLMHCVAGLELEGGGHKLWTMRFYFTTNQDVVDE